MTKHEIITLPENGKVVGTASESLDGAASANRISEADHLQCIANVGKCSTYKTYELSNPKISTDDCNWCQPTDKHTTKKNTKISNSARYAQSEAIQSHIINPASSRTASPTISIRSSTSISISSLNVNPIDSSIIDSESDFEVGSDEEVSRRNYVGKKLGQRTTYSPECSNISALNKDFTIVGQTVGQHSETAPSPATALINGIFKERKSSVDGIGSVSAISSMPQIGSISLNNSTGVTFGDKHFYEGPVTIQQFLVDSRSKRSETHVDGQDNPLFSGEDGSTKQRNETFKLDVNRTPIEAHPPLHKFISNPKATYVSGCIIILTIILGGLILAGNSIARSTIRKSKQLGDGDDSRKNIPISSMIAQENIGGGRVLRIVPRDAWLAQPPESKPIPLQLPVSTVVVMHTQTEDCQTQASCTYRVRFLQTYNIESTQFDDIIYNFLIGGDGSIYEGRGWEHVGAHQKGYNNMSISLAFIGTFKTQKPSARQMNATAILLDEGVRRQNLTPDYRIIGANTIDPSVISVPASALYENFKGWPHWSESVL